MMQQISLEDARKSLKKEKAVFIIDKELEDKQTIIGHIVYISKSQDTYDELIKQFTEHKMKSERAMVIGSYENTWLKRYNYNIKC